MAKGVEDTAFYVYTCLLSLNEVGGNPSRFGVSPEALHLANRDRRERWPRALSATSTHDTKRSEDVRARINVLSEMPEAWHEALTEWSQLTEPHRTQLDDAPAPDANEEYLIYQTLLGAWPLEPYTPDEFATFVTRVQDYLIKALHEAKVHSSWINPNAAYDDAVLQFVARILDDDTGAAFLEAFRPFQRRVSQYGLLNSLAQTLLKIASPGVTDVYQGTEVWDYSLVDPDNRRPVDYDHRRHLLNELRAKAREAGPDRRGLARELAGTMEDGRVKLYVVSEGLRCRRQHPGLFAEGEYLALEAVGPRRDHVFAFARRREGQWAVLVVPRLPTGLVPAGYLPVGREVWQDTRLRFPDGAWDGVGRNVFTGEELSLTRGDGGASAAVGDVLACFPVALFVGGTDAA
jgi:(1->4)-alpha-D-glucan 1-alpha-D-glucosylmutase